VQSGTDIVPTFRKRLWSTYLR